MSEHPPPETDRRQAVLAESLYLANLLVAPGIAFAALLVLRRRATGPLARRHVRQAIAGSLWAALLLLGLSGAILALGGFGSAWSWVWVIVYFTFFHSTLVLFGMVGLARALAGQDFRYPLIGPAG
jgi:uncharacterized Tic20 family protein